MKSKAKITYSKSGVNYDSLDYLKRLAQQKSKQTSKYLRNSKSTAIEESRGESAFVWDEGDCYRAFVIESLGTKSLVADEMRIVTGKTYYSSIAQDTVAAIINDLVSVGAKPQVLNAYFAAGDSEFWDDEKRTTDLVEGFAKACDLAQVTWGGGETPGLKKVVEKNAIDLAGSAVGIIKPKKRLILGDKLKAGDYIVLIESSGIHANGISLTRTIAKKLPEGFATKMPNGEMFGEALLTPTFIYSKLIQSLLDANIDLHYTVNITGHGWRKLMRAKGDLTYIIEKVLEPQEIFLFIQKHSGFSDEEMYATFNMGVGYAIFVSETSAQKVVDIATQNNFKAWNSGIVKKGPKQVLIKPKNIVYKAETLGVR